jgi:hypothetical protein
MAAMAKNLLEIFKIISISLSNIFADGYKNTGYSISLSKFVDHKAPFRFLNFLAVVFNFLF